MKARLRARPVSDARAKQLIAEIEASEGMPCPTDAEFSNRLKYANPSSVSAIMRHLRANDLIRNVGNNRRRRQLLVVASGKRTAPADPGRV